MLFRSEHFRRVRHDELTAVSPDVPAREKRIEVSLARQELMAFEGRRLVLRTRISSGIPDPRPKENGVPTITPDGVFHVTQKTPMRHMGDGHITADLEAHELPGVQRTRRLPVGLQQRAMAMPRRRCYSFGGLRTRMGCSGIRYVTSLETLH